MKMNLQYFAQQSTKGSGAVAPSSGAVKHTSGASVTPSSTNTAQSSTAGKTYTQADVNRMLSEAANDTAAKFADKVANAKAEQKKLDSMNQSEKTAYIKKVQKNKIDKIVAENKKYKHDVKMKKALEATTKALTNAHIPNASGLAKLAMNEDPNARNQNVQTIINWLSNYKDQIKSNLLKGKREPQTGNDTGELGSSSKQTLKKKLKNADPFQYAKIMSKLKGHQS